ncbi:hypothetical protein ATO12_09750 [Aquimarina atlantica]|uniref:Pectate lyase superfamily protein domain-containing protein n=1 Tax=Aquimarina atlantica TaxID=1317122 RepID=A0A023BYH5_9FLAO|nr:hypothetical protein [Aquimarina atlantica]EZH75004.1 hypothetical protein ATO12_09750 [Aquimarina atlantica]
MRNYIFIALVLSFIINSRAQSVLATAIFPNISELQNHPGNDDYVYVKGYYTPDDGGGGLFKNEISDLKENGGTVFNVNANPNKKWIRVYKGDINVKWFGARGTYSYNTDDTAAIQNAIYETQRIGNTLIIPKGDYRIVNSLKIEIDEKKSHIHRLKIKGEGYKGSNIYGAIDGGGYIFDLEMPEKTDNQGNTRYKAKITNMILSNLTLLSDTDIKVNDTTRIQRSNISGIKLKYNEDALIENIHFRNLVNDINAQSFWRATIKNCRSTQRHLDISSPRYIFNRQCNNLLIERCFLSNKPQNESSFLFKIVGDSSSINFISCNFEFGHGALIDNRGNAPLTNISFIGCYWEWLDYEAIAINNLANVRGVNVIDNYFNSKWNVSPYWAIVLGGVKGMNISGSYFYEFGKTPIYSAGYAEGVNVNMCTSNENFPIINSIPSNSFVFNPSSTNGNYGGLSLRSSNGISLRGLGASQSNKINYSSSIPITGSWNQGDIVYNTNAVPGGYVGWVYTNSGWKGFGLIENN